MIPWDCAINAACNRAPSRRAFAASGKVPQSAQSTVRMARRRFCARNHRGADHALGLLARALPDRWRHVRAVAACAEEVTELLGMRTESLVCAAWLRDVR